MRVNGNIVLNSNASGEIRNVYLERVASIPPFDGSQDGRLFYNLTTKAFVYNDGTQYQNISTGGSSTGLQEAIDNLIATVGPVASEDGSWTPSAISSAPIIGTASSITDALLLLANGISASVTSLASLTDVTLSAPEAGQFLHFNGEKWENKFIELSNVSGVTVTAEELNTLPSDVAGLNAQLLEKQNASPRLDYLDQALGSDGNGLLAGGGSGVTLVHLESSSAGLDISNGDGVGGNPVFSLIGNVGAIDNLTDPGFVVLNGEGNAVSRTISGVSGRTVVQDGNGVAAGTVVDLAPVVQDTSTTGKQFVKTIIDGYGRVTGNTPVTTDDITPLIDSLYVGVNGGSLAGDLNMNGNRLTGLALPTGGTDAVSKSYVDSVLSGLSWKDPVENVQNVDTGTGSLDSTGLVDGDRVLNLFDSKIYTYDGSAFDLGITPSDGWALFDRSSETGYVFSGSEWVQFNGAGQITDGVGLIKTGNILSVKMGAGVKELPTDSVGLDVRAGQAIILSTDGSTESTADNAQLTLKLLPTGGLTQSTSGLGIAASGVLNTMLANSGFTLTADSGTDVISLGESLSIKGTAEQGISVSISESPVGNSAFVVTAADATTTQKGVASFAAASFAVADGAVTIKTGGVSNAQLANSAITVNTIATSLGGSLTLGSAVAGLLTFTPSGSTLNIGVRAASTTDAGVASFNPTDFSVTGGVVSANAKSITALSDVLVSSVTSGDAIVYSATAGKYVNRRISATYTAPTAALSHTVAHGIGTKYVTVTVLDGDTDEVIIPNSIHFDSATQLTVTFTDAVKCVIVCAGVNAS